MKPFEGISPPGSRDQNGAGDKSETGNWETAWEVGVAGTSWVCCFFVSHSRISSNPNVSSGSLKKRFRSVHIGIGYCVSFAWTILMPSNYSSSSRFSLAKKNHIYDQPIRRSAAAVDVGMDAPFWSSLAHPIGGSLGGMSPTTRSQWASRLPSNHFHRWYKVGPEPIVLNGVIML